MPPKRKAPKAEAAKPAPKLDNGEEVPIKKTKKGMETKQDPPVAAVVEKEIVEKKKRGAKEPKEIKQSEPVEENSSTKNKRQARATKKVDDEKLNAKTSDATDEASLKKTRGAKQIEKPVVKAPAKESAGAKRGAKKTKQTKNEDFVEEVIPEKKKRGIKELEQTDEIIDVVDTEEVYEPVKKKRGAKETKQVEKVEGESNGADEVMVKPKRGAKEPNEGTKAKKAKESKKDVKEKAPTKAAAKKTEPKATPLNATETKWDSINFESDKKNKKGQNHNLKITSWNVDGIRAWLKKDGHKILNYDKPDIFCLQEIKCSADKLPEELAKVDGYHAYWCPSKKDGYAGVGVYSKIEPLNVTYGIENDDHDDEGRCITCEYDGFYLVNVYVPNAGRGLVTLPKRLEWNELFKMYIKKLDEKKPVIICGDMNVAHNEIDLSNPKTNKKNAGFTQEERDGMTDFLEDGDYVDTFRDLYPEEKDVYTFWSYMSKARSKNVGWRLDYFIVSKRINENICDNVVKTEVYGSDHCPITLFINI